MQYTTEEIREYRRRIALKEAEIEELAESESISDAEAYEDLKVERLELERDCLAYALRACITDPPTRTFADIPYAARLALGELSTEAD